MITAGVSAAADKRQLEPQKLLKILMIMLGNVWPSRCCWILGSHQWQPTWPIVRDNGSYSPATSEAAQVAHSCFRWSTIISRTSWIPFTWVRKHSTTLYICVLSLFFQPFSNSGCTLPHRCLMEVREDLGVICIQDFTHMHVYLICGKRLIMVIIWVLFN